MSSSHNQAQVTSDGYQELVQHVPVVTPVVLGLTSLGRALLQTMGRAPSCYRLWAECGYSLASCLGQLRPVPPDNVQSLQLHPIHLVPCTSTHTHIATPPPPPPPPPIPLTQNTHTHHHEFQQSWLRTWGHSTLPWIQTLAVGTLTFSS